MARRRTRWLLPPEACAVTRQTNRRRPRELPHEQAVLRARACPQQTHQSYRAGLEVQKESQPPAGSVLPSYAVSALPPPRDGQVAAKAPPAWPQVEVE
jgi:hypothetical protein